MANPQELLARRVQDGLAAAFGEAFAHDDPVMRPSQHADFQANVALSLADRLRCPPREVAAGLARSLQITDICRESEVSGPLDIVLRRKPWTTSQK
jgi:arginyl-tRNA synthetase